MWPSNPLTQRLNLRFPIMLAPMGIITTPALAAAVSNAGGLGGIGMWGLTGCGKSRDFGKMVMKRARSANPDLIKSTGYEGAKTDELGWKQH
jgi:nitronate monooxygenase